jgi:hypothetical protein
MSEIETAIENLIQFHIDENDFITRVDAEQYFEEGIASALDDANFITGMEAEQYTDQCVSDLQDDISELIVRIEALEEFKALEDKAREDKALDLLDTVARAEIDSVDSQSPRRARAESREPDRLDLGRKSGQHQHFRGLSYYRYAREVCALELGNRRGIENHDDHHDDTGNSAQSYQRKTGGRIMRVIIELEFENLPSQVDVENYLKELIDDGSLFYHLAQGEAKS